MSNSPFQDFCAIFNLKNLIKDPTCFKNFKKRSRIDHTLLIHPECF